MLKNWILAAIGCVFLAGAVSAQTFNPAPPLVPVQQPMPTMVPPQLVPPNDSSLWSSGWSQTTTTRHEFRPLNVPEQVLPQQVAQPTYYYQPAQTYHQPQQYYTQPTYYQPRPQYYYYPCR